MEKRLIIGLCLLLSIGSAKSQVTIGSGIKPASGALLDLKQEEKTDGSANSSKGMLLPRVNLTNKANLYPMFEDDNAGGYKIGTTPYTKADEDKKHIGLTVFHPDMCTMDGKGIYIWTPDGWTKLGDKFLAGLNLSTDKLTFWNGIANTAQTVDVSWSATEGIIIPPTYDSSVELTFTSSPASGTLANSPETVSFKPADMTIGSNPFVKQSGQIIFSFQNSPCATSGFPQKKIIEVDLINKALTVNGKIKPDQVEATGTNGATINQTADVKSNAKWKFASITPTTNPAVTSVDLGNSYGVDDSVDPTATTDKVINYNVKIAPNVSRYTYLTFQDDHSPKRFNDVVLTVAQCTGNTDLSMEQYKNLWEQMYGLDPNNDEPDSDGDTSKNKNKVQWHRDQDGNIYFSAMYGTERWMTTNLAAKSYDTLSPNKPSLTLTYASNPSPYTAAYYAYPNTHGTTNAGLTTQYDARQRLGLLYNWAAATGNQNTSTGQQQNTTHGPHQGICPDGWHLPTDKEWTDLETTLKASPTQWSGNSTGNNTAETIKDMCEPTVGNGKSFGILDGGFNALLAGYAGGGSASSYQSNGHFWSSSSTNGNYAWFRAFGTGGGAVLQYGNNRNYLFSVRCKK